MAGQWEAELAICKNDVHRAQRQEIGQLATLRPEVREHRFSNAKAAGQRTIAPDDVSGGLQKPDLNRTHTPKTSSRDFWIFPEHNRLAFYSGRPPCSWASPSRRSWH